MQVIILDGQFCDLNTYINAERRNRFIAAKIKKDATETILRLLSQNEIDPITEKSSFSFMWYVPNKRKDPDNVSFGAKYIFDALVRSGILPDDTMQWVHCIHHYFLIDKERPRVEIIITTDEGEDEPVISE